MKTETIEWFTPEEKLPDDGVIVLCIAGGACGAGYYKSDPKEWCGWIMDFTPDFWSYQPKGPQ